jgi:hypothetical protein
MKKQLTVALGLAVLATPAFATKARLQALGEDVNGSYYVNDNRNIFLNPAHVNTHKDLVTFELGDTTQVTDATATPRAEGGYFRQAGNLVWGVQFGSEANTSHQFRALAMGADVVGEENNLDLFVGGDSGLKWGANLTYSKSSEDELGGATDGDTQEAMRTRFGVVMGDTQVFGALNLTNKAEAASGAEFKGKLGYRLGATHAWEGYTLFGNWQSLTGENVGADSDIKASTLELGAGRQTRLNDRANLFARLQLTRTTVEVEPADETKTMSLPVVVGLETEATSWLTLRASVSQALWSSVDTDGDKAPLHETTTVNAGASLKFGELTVDGVVGNTATDGTTVASGTNSGTLRTDVLMTRVGMTYRF